MKEKLYFLVLCVSLCCFSVFAEEGSAEMKNNYIPPDNLELSLAPAADRVFKGSIKCLLGSPKQMKVFFESSDDWMVSPTSIPWEKIAEGENRDCEFKVEPSNKKPDDGGSWVRLRVEYLPDYEKMLEKVSSNVPEYPDALEREKLLDRIKEAGTEKLVQTDVIRHFIGE